MDLFRVLKDLHWRREGAPFVVAEEGAAGSRGQHQVVVAVGIAVEGDLLAFGEDVGHLPQQHLNVALLAIQFAEGRCDVSTGHQTGRDLSQQRLKQVEVVLVDQGDARAGKALANVDVRMGAWRRRYSGCSSSMKKRPPAIQTGEFLAEIYGVDSGLSVLCTA